MESESYSPFFGRHGVAPPPVTWPHQAAIRRGSTEETGITRDLVRRTALYIPIPATRRGALFHWRVTACWPGRCEVDVYHPLSDFIDRHFSVLSSVKTIHLVWPRAETPTHYSRGGCTRPDRATRSLKEMIDFLMTRST